MQRTSVLCAMWIVLVPMLLGAGQVRSDFQGPTVSEIVRMLGDEAGAGGMVARTIARVLGQKLD